VGKKRGALFKNTCRISAEKEEGKKKQRKKSLIVERVWKKVYVL